MAKTRKPNQQTGLGQPFPSSLAGQLERQYGKLNTEALTLIRLRLVPAIAADDPTEITIALDLIHEEMASRFPDERIEEEARAMANRVNQNHSKRFFSALAVAAGVKILGGDGPRTALGGGGSGMMPPTPGPAGFVPPIGRKRATVGVKVSVAPEVFAEEFTAMNVAKIGELRAGIREGLSEAIVRARQFGGDDPTETAARLLDIWEKNGVPSALPTARLKKNGEPVMLNTRKHSKMVAHDQIAKLNAGLNETRQRAAGGKAYRYTTRGDDRVRDTHRATAAANVGHGVGVYLWDEPPAIGHPGSEPGCRCVATAVDITAATVAGSSAYVEI